MKIIVGGLPPALNAALLQQFRSLPIVTMSCQDSVRLWQTRMTACDLCLISPKLISHKHIGIVRAVVGNKYQSITGLSSAVTFIQAHLQKGLQ